MGEIVKDLPNMNTDPHVINQKLLKPLEEHKKYIVPQDCPQAESGNTFWRTFFSRLQEHPGKEYLNLYDKSEQWSTMDEWKRELSGEGKFL